MLRSITIILIALATGSICQADNWPQFRGPHFNGSSKETNLPSSWSTTENVAWAAPLPGPSAATPIVWNDPETDTELWRWGTWNPERIGHWRLIPSPVASDKTVLVCAPKREPIYAVRIGGTGRLTDDALAWVSDDQKELSSDVPTPAYADGDFFILSDVRKTLSRVEPETGNVKWTLRTPGDVKYESSPLVADGKVYLINFSAEVAVIDAQEGRLMNVIKMDDAKDDAVRATIVAAQGQLLIRTTDRLFCIGADKKSN
jgi:outer membrane protein assembly factor BamB